MLKKLLPIALIVMMLFSSMAFAAGNGASEAPKAAEPKQVSRQEAPEVPDDAEFAYFMMRWRCIDLEGPLAYNYAYFYDWTGDLLCTDGSCVFEYGHGWMWPCAPEPVAEEPVVEEPAEDPTEDPADEDPADEDLTEDSAE